MRACDCVAGYAQRKYGQLGTFIQARLGRPVRLSYAESLMAPNVRRLPTIHLIVGKYSVVESDAQEVGQRVRPLAMLSGKDGAVTLEGLVVVRAADRARSIEDLAGRSILFGPKDSDEKHAAGLAALEAFALAEPAMRKTSPGCSSAALAVVENEADAAVVSSYAMPLLEGCGTIDRGALRIVGRTDPVPFIGVFATDAVVPSLEKQLADALAAVGDDAELLTAMESRTGFVPLPDLWSEKRRAAGWPDWRGPNRDAVSPDVPAKLTAATLLWSHTMTGPGMSGLAVADGYVIAADKSFDERDDVFRCLDAETGRQVWKLAYPVPDKMDFTNSPRANPVIRDGLVYLLGAFGHLHCVRLGSGDVVWSKNLPAEFAAKVPTWGYCSTPLVVGHRLIVNPGAERASLVALDRRSGERLWAAPGDPPGYGSFVLASFSGVEQIVGYDAVSLGGWDPQTGRRLWKLVPQYEGDFNVPTPIVVGDKLLVSTENNGTRLYGFDGKGRIIPEPLAANEDLAPDTSTPAVENGLVLGSCFRLVCLDLNKGLGTLWEHEEDPFCDYASVIGGNGRFLVTTQVGKLGLVEADRAGFRCAGTVDLFRDVADTERDVWSHPALVGNRLYIRNLLATYCFLLE